MTSLYGPTIYAMHVDSSMTWNSFVGKDQFSPNCYLLA